MIIFIETRFVEDNHSVFFAAVHAEGCYGKENPLPCESLDIVQRQFQIPVFVVNGKFLCTVSEGFGGKV